MWMEIRSVLGTRYSVLGTQYSVLATRYSVLSTRYSLLVLFRFGDVAGFGDVVEEGLPTRIEAGPLFGVDPGAVRIGDVEQAVSAGADEFGRAEAEEHVAG